MLGQLIENLLSRRWGVLPGGAIGFRCQDSEKGNWRARQ